MSKEVVAFLSKLKHSGSGENMEETLISTSSSKFLAMYNSSKNYFSFPIASCISHQNYRPVDSDSSNNESLSVPGLHFKRKTLAEKQSVSELEVKEWLEKETGMDRIRQMYATGNDGLFIQEETQVMNKLWFRTVLVGFCLNMIATTLAADKRKKKLTMSKAMQSDYTTLLPKSAYKEIFTSTFRLSIWAGSLIYISQTMAAYRNKTSVWEYVISSAVGFGTARCTGGVMKMASFTTFGVLFGYIGGHLLCKLMTDNSVTQEMRHTRHIKQFLQDKRSAEDYTSHETREGNTL